MNQLVREKIETKLEKISAMAKHQHNVIVKRGDVARDVEQVFTEQQKLVEDIKGLITIL